MRLFCRIFTLVLATSSFVNAQARFPMKYLDDVGLVGLGLPSSKDRVDLGFASVVSENGDVLRFEGRDHKGDPWRAWIPQMSGVGWTGVWTADFDHNGLRDLLIAVHPGINGRCTGRADLLFLLFDPSGRPLPWHAATEIPNGRKFPYLPAILLDLNGDGRAEIVSTACEYGDQSQGHWTDWSITGAYEARDGRWIPLRTDNADPYRRAASKANGIKEWLPIKPNEWLDELTGFNSPSNMKLERLIPPDEACRNVHIPIAIVDGVAVIDHSCAEMRQEHALYSDGRTPRGWPWVVIDGPHGRDIFVANNEDALRRVIREGYRVKLLGDDAEPSWLWAEETQAIVPLP